MNIRCSLHTILGVLHRSSISITIVVLILMCPEKTGHEILLERGSKELLVAADRAASEQPGWAEAVWGRAKLLASRCFDGIRRAWRWLKRKVIEVADSVRHAIQNLWRTTVRRLSKRFSHIVDVFRAVGEGIRGAVDKAVGFDDIPTAALSREVDS